MLRDLYARSKILNFVLIMTDLSPTLISSLLDQLRLFEEFFEHPDNKEFQ